MPEPQVKPRPSIRMLSKPQDFQRYGIDCLTGERDPFCYRILYDVTATGKAIICAALGLPEDCKFCENWNSGTKEDPHVGSIMLSTAELYGSIAVMCLLSENYDVVIITDHNVVGTMHANVDVNNDRWGFFYANDEKYTQSIMTPYGSTFPYEEHFGCKIINIVFRKDRDMKSLNKSVMRAEMAKLLGG